MHNTLAAIIAPVATGLATGIDASDISANVAAAGPRFTWSGIRGSSRQNSVARRGMAAIMFYLQGEACMTCGESVDFSHFDCGHIVPRGADNKGWTNAGAVIGNIIGQCKTCNAVNGQAVIGFDELQDADKIVRAFPGITVLRAVGAAMPARCEGCETCDGMRGAR